MEKIKQIACGNDYESEAFKDGEYDTDKTYNSINDLLIAATPKNWNVEDWEKVDDNKYKLGETSVYIVIE